LADLEVFLEAVGLEEVAQFEGADVTAAGADFALEVGDHGVEVLEGEASAQQLVPHPFAVIGQAQVLPGQLAIELVGRRDRRGADLAWLGGRGRAVHGRLKGWWG
jgi:hypothetical protein